MKIISISTFLIFLINIQYLMISEQVRSPRRSTSINRYGLSSFKTIKQPPKNYILLAKTLKTILAGKLSQSLNQVKSAAERRKNLKKCLQNVCLIGNKNMKRRGLNSLKVKTRDQNKKLYGLNIIKIVFKNAFLKRKKQCFQLVKDKFFNKNKEKLFELQFNCLQKFMTKKLNDEKRISFHKIRYESKIRKLTLKSMEKIIGNKVLFKKLDSFFKLSLNNLNQKNSNLLNQSPTAESQENMKYVQALKQEENVKNERNLNRYKSEKKIQHFNKKLRESLEKSRRSLSRKSRLSSLVDDDFTYILTGSYSSKDYRNMKGQSDKQDYYKNMAKTYKKQLQIVKSELQVTKEMNEAIENEMDDFNYYKVDREVKKLRREVQMLEKDKKKYKERSRNYEKQIQTMKQEFKRRIEHLQLKLRKQL